MQQPEGPYWLEPGSDPARFPDPYYALKEPNGLLAVGGDLSPLRILNAYRQGIFPWFNEGQPILWWSPDPRMVLFPEKLHVSRSLKKKLRQCPFRVTLDGDFAAVIEACSQSRPGQQGTWITEEMKLAYMHLNQIGFAHSVECWEENKLVGGLYGLSLGKVFFGESMFSRHNDASKIAFAHLVAQLREWDFSLIDCQVHSAHLESLGAEDILREDFLDMLDQYCEPINAHQDRWWLNPEISRTWT